MSRRPVHLLAGEPVAERVIAVGDPGRARLLAGLLEESRLVSDNRGLLVFNGKWRGVPVTVATHGMGAPSALIVFEELAMLGAKVIVRLGTAGGIPGRAGPGDIVVASSASMLRHGCGLEAYLPRIVPPLSPDPRLTLLLAEKLSAAGLRVVVGPVFCSDSFYAETGLLEELERAGIVAVEMEAAALFALSHMRGFRAAAAFVVSNTLGGEFLDPGRLASMASLAGRRVLDALVEYD